MILVEPWCAPGVLDPELVFQHAGEENGARVSRVTRTEIEERLSRLHFEYEIADATGTRRAHEVHELGLFTTEELIRTFTGAGLAVDYDPNGLPDRGLNVARIAA